MTDTLRDEPAGAQGPGKPGWRDPTRLAYLANNLLSLIGFLLIGVGLILLVTFALFSLLSRSVSPYIGIVGYVILPAIFIAGLILVPAGMLLKQGSLRWRARRLPGEVVFPRIDLNNPKTRRSIFIFAAFSCLVVLPVLAVSGYFGYQWTESTEFCGKVCHTVMKPQYTAHERSPHARVPCAGCHIGPGASWFVKAKITGLGQVVAVLRNSYPRPLPNAITNLRPARETCEECHWPAQFFGLGYRRLLRYLPDETNTPFTMRLLLRTGGADRLSGRVEGIHMHMTESGRMEYVATDPDLQHIVWVRHTLPDGRSVVYRSDGNPTEAPIPAGVTRRLDCMDCHNRGAHHFAAPQDAVDLYLAAGRIDPGLPFIKREAIRVLTGSYVGEGEALDAIDRGLTGFYRDTYPPVLVQRGEALRRTVAAAQEIYEQNFFPVMKENWGTYPENIGHKNSAGCFRCHDGLHVEASGKTIPSGCLSCHDFLTPLADRPDTLAEGTFQHPMDLAKHLNLRCDQCHNGGVLLDCRDCHVSGQWLDHRGQADFRREVD